MPKWSKRSKEILPPSPSYLCTLGLIRLHVFESIWYILAKSSRLLKSQNNRRGFNKDNQNKNSLYASHILRQDRTKSSTYLCHSLHFTHKYKSHYMFHETTLNCTLVFIWKTYKERFAICNLSRNLDIQAS